MTSIITSYYYYYSLPLLVHLLFVWLPLLSSPIILPSLLINSNVKLSVKFAKQH